MCRTRPCWGTPEEIKKIIDAGFRTRLMKDYWDGTRETDYKHVFMLSPAIVGYENSDAPPEPRGKCTFLTKDNKCELHDLGLKPYEGRVSCCKVSHKTNVHKECALSWNNPEAQALANA
jgi:hypothetical protein